MNERSRQIRAFQLSELTKEEWQQFVLELGGVAAIRLADAVSELKPLLDAIRLADAVSELKA